MSKPAATAFELTFDLEGPRERIEALKRIYPTIVGNKIDGLRAALMNKYSSEYSNPDDAADHVISELLGFSVEVDSGEYVYKSHDLDLKCCRTDLQDEGIQKGIQGLVSALNSVTKLVEDFYLKQAALNPRGTGEITDSGSRSFPAGKKSKFFIDSFRDLEEGTISEQAALAGLNLFDEEAQDARFRRKDRKFVEQNASLLQELVSENTRRITGHLYTRLAVLSHHEIGIKRNEWGAKEGAGMNLPETNLAYAEMYGYDKTALTDLVAELGVTMPHYEEDHSSSTVSPEEKWKIAQQEMEKAAKKSSFTEKVSNIFERFTKAWTGKDEFNHPKPTMEECKFNEGLMVNVRALADKLFDKSADDNLEVGKSSLASVVQKINKARANFVVVIKSEITKPVQKAIQDKAPQQKEEIYNKTCDQIAVVMISSGKSSGSINSLFTSLGRGGKFSKSEIKDYELNKLDVEQIIGVFSAMEIFSESRHRLAKDNTQFPARLVELNKDRLSIEDVVNIGKKLLEIKKSKPRDEDAINPEQSESMKQIAKILKEKIKALEKEQKGQEKTEGKHEATAKPEVIKGAADLIRIVDPKYKTTEEKAKEVEKKAAEKAAEKPRGICSSAAVIRLVSRRAHDVGNVGIVV